MATKQSSRARSASRRRSFQTPWGVLGIWPVLAGAVIAIFIVRIAAAVAIVAPEAAKFVLPLPYLVKGIGFGVDSSFVEKMSEFATYAQFPIYGLLLTIFCRRLRVEFALLWLIGLHAVAYIFAAFVLHT